MTVNLKRRLGTDICSLDINFSTLFEIKFLSGAGSLFRTICQLKKMKKTHGGVLLLIKLQALALKVTPFHGCFHEF